MGYFVIKVAPERDAYLVLHSSTDTVCAYGDRKQVKKALYKFDDRKKNRIRKEDPSHPENMMAKADESGSSSWFGGGEWDADEIMYCTHQDGKGQQRLRREHFSEVYDRFAAACVTEWVHPDLQVLLLDHEED